MVLLSVVFQSCFEPHEVVMDDAKFRNSFTSEGIIITCITAGYNEMSDIAGNI